jgi:hypothetical protein
MTQAEFYRLITPLIEQGRSPNEIRGAIARAYLAQNPQTDAITAQEYAATMMRSLPAGGPYDALRAAGDLPQTGGQDREPVTVPGRLPGEMETRRDPMAAVLDEPVATAGQGVDYIRKFGTTMSEDELADIQRDFGLSDEVVEDALLAAQMQQAEDQAPVPPTVGAQMQARPEGLFPDEPEEVEYERRLAGERTERALAARARAVAEEKARLAGEMLERRQAREYEQAPKALRRQEIIRLIKEGGEGFRSEDPLVQDMAREFADLRRNELKSAVFGTLRNMGAAVGEQLTGRAIKRGPLTPQPDPMDTTAADRKAAQQLLVAESRNIPKLFAVDANNIKEARTFLIDFIDQVRQRGDAREKNSLDASLGRLTARTDIASEHITVAYKMMEGLQGKFAETRDQTVLQNEFAKAVHAAGTDIFNLPVEQSLAKIIRKIARNEEEVDSLRRAAAVVLDRDSAESAALQDIITEYNDSTETFLVETAPIWDAVREDLPSAQEAAGMTAEQIRETVRDGAADDIERLAAQDLVDNPEMQVELVEMLEIDKFPEVLNGVITDHVRAGFAEQSLAPLAQENATMLGYKDAQHMMQSIMGMATPASKREEAIDAATGRMEDLQEKAFKRPNPFRTRQFKQQLLMPENQHRLAALDKFAKSMNLSRDDSLKALALQFARDQKKSREAAPNVLAQIARGQTAAEIKAQKSLRVMDQPGTKRGVDVIPVTPVPPEGDEDVEEKVDSVV